MFIGFSTGSISKGDFRAALEILDRITTNSVELSALRELELQPLVDALPTLDLAKYGHISIHAPSKLVIYSEPEVVEILLVVVRMGYPVIVHPDIIVDFKAWLPLGDGLCIENMDKRKAIGRTKSDLEEIFQSLPKAKFCLDIAHAKQVDPSMIECAKLLIAFKDRLLQLHVSDVTSDSHHVPLSLQSISAFQKIAPFVPSRIPIILESPVQLGYLEREVKNVIEIFAGRKITSSIDSLVSEQSFELNVSAAN